MQNLDSLVAQFESGKLSRRQFMMRLSGLGLALPLAGSILAGTHRGAAAETPNRGGRLRIGFTATSQNEHWDPARRFSRMMGNRNNSVYNTLVNPTSELKAAPGLAESWEANETGDEWVFKIRQGVEFHDGRTLRAEDVIYTIERVRDPEVGSAGSPLLSEVEEIRAEDSSTLRIKLSSPNVDFPLFLASDFLNVIPEGHTDFTKVIGTGPFMYQSFEPSRSALVVRNPNYWESGLPYLDEVETFAIPDHVARLNALISGEIDCLNEVDPSLVAKVEATEGIRLLSTPSGYRVPNIMRTDVAPYDNPDVRLALKLLLDREKFNTIVYNGHSTVGNDHPVAPIYPEFCEEIPLRQYDPDQAKSLLKKADALDYPFELLASSIGTGGLEGAQVFSQMAQQAGVNLNVKRVPSDGFWDAVWMKAPFHCSHWQARPTANLQLTVTFKSDAPWNDSYWYRDDFDKLLLESRSTFDAAKRQEIYCAMQEMVRDDGGHLIPAFPNILDVVSDKVQNVQQSPLGSLDNLKVQNTCWLAA